ncbi:hypothetical protein TELCIR_04242 [Teladorsagia circumcincta]|uniref:Transmembrane protein 234 n=1 Tax=Teladorsagia circumcincta TaxID=45464 RepID=A0A2G9UU56_TELCI|nr:hypothetical protein TELCIR_04242 [Teladorsagia circumcincta]
MSGSSGCSLECCLSMLAVGFLWGATNPLLRLGSKSSTQSISRTGKGQHHGLDKRLHGVVSKFLPLLLDTLHYARLPFSRLGSCAMRERLAVNV